VQDIKSQQNNKDSEIQYTCNYATNKLHTKDFFILFILFYIIRYTPASFSTAYFSV